MRHSSPAQPKRGKKTIINFACKSCYSARRSCDCSEVAWVVCRTISARALRSGCHWLAYKVLLIFAWEGDNSDSDGANGLWSGCFLSNQVRLVASERGRLVSLVGLGNCTYVGRPSAWRLFWFLIRFFATLTWQIQYHTLLNSLYLLLDKQPTII